MLFFYIHHFYYCNFLFKNNLSKNRLLFNCGKSLNQITFRLPKRFDSNVLTSAFIFKNILSYLFKKNNFEFKKSNTAFFDSSINSKQIRTEYLSNLNKEKEYTSIFKNELLVPTSIINSLQIILFCTIFFPFVFTISLFKKDKKHLPFLFQEAIECYNLISYLKKNNITNLHYFSIFERDANLCAYLLMKNNIYVNKIPSEVPLFAYNSCVVANELSFCFAYQKEEFEYFKETMFVSETQDWCPELIFNAPKRFFKKEKIENGNFECDVAFYSSGNWLRRLQGDAELETNDAENELLILTNLVEVCEKYKLKLRVFCHPIEKRNQSETNNYYSQFKSSSISLADFNQPSIEEFDKVNIGVSLLSTLMYERIYLGFKTILVPLNFNGFPITGSNFNNICVKFISELEHKLISNIQLSNKDFFYNNGISQYSKIYS